MMRDTLCLLSYAFGDKPKTATKAFVGASDWRAEGGRQGANHLKRMLK